MNDQQSVHLHASITFVNVKVLSLLAVWSLIIVPGPKPLSCLHFHCDRRGYHSILQWCRRELKVVQMWPKASSAQYQYPQFWKNTSTQEPHTHIDVDVDQATNVTNISLNPWCLAVLLVQNPQGYDLITYNSGQFYMLHQLSGVRDTQLMFR